MIPAGHVPVTRVGCWAHNVRSRFRNNSVAVDALPANGPSFPDALSAPG
jgi:hypothetical protein